MIFTVYIFSVYNISFCGECRHSNGVPAQEIMYTSLFDALVSDSLFSPMRTVYVVSDSQLEEIQRNQRQLELDNLEASRKRLEETFQSRIKIIDEREHELQEELKSLAQVNREVEKVAVKPR